VVQVIEHLPSKCKALSSNPSTDKKRKKKVQSTSTQAQHQEYVCGQAWILSMIWEEEFGWATGKSYRYA
jgi:hypothetical protein